MEVLLVRYAEIGLKSKNVRSRFENRLKDNLIQMLASDGVEAIVTKSGARFLIKTDDMDKAIFSVRKVFGVASVSIAKVCDSDIESICQLASEYSKNYMKKGKTFAVKARRTGTHPFTSMDIAKIVGDAIWNANLDKDPKVNLTSPDLVFYVEVRSNETYVFNEIIRCHAGLPIGTQGLVYANVNNERGLLGAWFIMKRGCKLIVNGNHGLEVLKAYDPNLKTQDKNDSKKNILAYVLDNSMDTISSINIEDYALPVFFPTIAITDAEVSEKLNGIRQEISH